MKDLILVKVLEGHCFLFGPSRNEEEAYRCYLDALSLSKEEESIVLEVECLRALIQYGLFTKNNLTEINRYIDYHGQLAYDKLEILQNQYFLLRCQAEINYGSTGDIPFSFSVWESLLSECHDSSYFRLEVETRSVYAQILDYCGFSNMAMEEYWKALTTAAEHSDEYYQDVKFTSLGNMGHSLMQQRKYREALNLFMQLLDRSFPQKRLSNQAKIYGWMSDCYKKMGLIDSAYYYLDLSYQKKEENNETAKTIAVREIQSKYDNERLGRALVEESLRRKQNNLTAFTIGGVLLVVSMFIWFHYYRQRKRNQKIQQDLDIANKEIQLTAVNARLDGQELEKKNLASFLHDHIVGQLVAANMHLKIASHNQQNESLEKTAQLVHDAGILIRNMSHDLYPPVLLKMGLGPALQDLCEKYTNNHLTIDINPQAAQIRLKGDAIAKVYYAVQELLNNVTKHSQASKCEIDLSTSTDQLTVTIRDNGVGMGQPEEHSAGLGLNTVRARVESLGGSFLIHDHDPGLSQTISIPLQVFHPEKPPTY
ncbi:MAG: hypothetical protein KDC80_28855 [Saprospiraceae bacterium]|nr:hypothetical protein [Saprospiraceae bacterium]